MKGRNSRFILLRNQSLIKRYYYWYELQRLRRDDVLKHLSEKEFFLDEKTIGFIIRQNDHLLKEIRRSKPTGKALEEFIFQSKPEPPAQTAILNCGLFAMAV